MFQKGFRFLVFLFRPIGLHMNHNWKRVARYMCTIVLQLYRMITSVCAMQRAFDPIFAGICNTLQSSMQPHLVENFYKPSYGRTGCRPPLTLKLRGLRSGPREAVEMAWKPKEFALTRCQSRRGLPVLVLECVLELMCNFLDRRSLNLHKVRAIQIRLASATFFLMS